MKASSRSLWHLCAAALLAAALVACGGGSSSGSSSGSTPAPGSQTGSLTLGLIGGAPGGYQHAWVTVSAVALNTDAQAAWPAADGSWQLIRLDAPVTVDLAASASGHIASLLTGQTLPAGSYGQMRLFVLPYDAPLAASASQLQLAYNAQVNYVDSSGTARQVPLEFADTALGLRIVGPISVGADVATTLTLQWDLEHSLARFASDDGIDRITMRPDLHWYDMSQSGAIVGLIDKSLFCTAGASAACIHDAVATAQLPSGDGSFELPVRSAPVFVDGNYAVFTLHPLPPITSGQTFDVVIRGRNMRTMVVHAVPASAADLLAANPTQLGVDMTNPQQPVPAPMVPMLSAQGDAQLSLSAPSTPASAQLRFGQTLPGGSGPPLEIAVANTSPFTGPLAQPLPLPGGPLRVATYTANGVLAFSDTTPQEGAESYSAMTLGTRYDEPSTIAVVAAPSGSTVAMQPPATTANPAISKASLSIGIAGGSGAGFDAAQLVVSDAYGIVATQDVSALIGVSGARATLQLPAGANAAALGGTAVYSVAIRAWRRAAPAASLQWAHAAAPVDMRGGNAASTSVSLP